MKQLKYMQRSCLNFIWHNKAHRIAVSVFLAPCSRGSLGAPDLIKYYYATHLSVTISWSTRMASSRWSEIKMSGYYVMVNLGYVYYPIKKFMFEPNVVYPFYMEKMLATFLALLSMPVSIKCAL